MHQAVVNLVRSEWDLVTSQPLCRAAHLWSAEVAHPHSADLACLDGLCHPVHERLDTQQRERPVDVIQIDCLDAQAAQAGIEGVEKLTAREARGQRREFAGKQRWSPVLLDTRAQEPL